MADHATVAGFSQTVDVRWELPQVSAVIQPHLNDAHRPVTWHMKDNAQPNLKGIPASPAHWCIWEKPGMDSVQPAQNLYRSRVKKMAGIHLMGLVKQMCALNYGQNFFFCLT